MLQPAKAHAAESTVSVTSEKLRLPVVTLIHDTVQDRNGIATLEYPLLAVGFPALISATVLNIDTNVSNLFTKIAGLR